MYWRILVPLDGSALAERALAHAEGVVAPRGEIRLVQVVPPGRGSPAAGAGGPEGAREGAESPRRAAEAYLSEVARRLLRPGITVTTQVLEGDPVEQLVEAARGADIVVLAALGRSGRSRFAVGSVAERIVRHAPTAVLVARDAPGEAMVPPGVTDP